MTNLIALFFVSKIFVWSFIKLSFLQKSVSLNNCGVRGSLGDFKGSVNVVSSGIADEIFGRGFGDSKEDTADGFRDCFHKVNGGGFSVGTKLSACMYT